MQRAQELVICSHKKLGKKGERPARMSRELQVKLKGKEDMQRQWKQGRVSGKSIGSLIV